MLLPMILVKTYISMMYTIMSAFITLIMMWLVKIEILYIMVHLIYTE